MTSQDPVGDICQTVGVEKQEIFRRSALRCTTSKTDGLGASGFCMKKPSKGERRAESGEPALRVDSAAELAANARDQAQARRAPEAKEKEAKVP